VFCFHSFLLCADLQGCAEDPLWAGPAQILFHMHPSPLCCLTLFQHCHICLPEAPFHLLPKPEPHCGSSVLSAASSIEPLHLQHEEPGFQGFNMETVDWVFICGHRLSTFFCKWLPAYVTTGTLAFLFGVCWFIWLFFLCVLVVMLSTQKSPSLPSTWVFPCLCDLWFQWKKALCVFYQNKWSWSNFFIWDLFSVD